MQHTDGLNMLHQIVEIHEENRYLCLERGFLTIYCKEEQLGKIPLSDIAVLLLSAQSISLSKPVLNALTEYGAITIFCGKNYLPISVVLPVDSHYLHASIIKHQINASLPLKKNIWKSIVESKINNQGKVLEICGLFENAPLVYKIGKMVRSGDPENREAYAARIYWKSLFGKEFIRDKNGEGINGLLNYGYAVVRAAMARAICGAGLLPALGIHHNNEQNAFCLADDLFEPFRPLVDFQVHSLSEDGIQDVTIEAKKKLARILWIKVRTNEVFSPLYQSFNYYADSFVASLRSKKPVIQIPVWDGFHEELSNSE